MLIEKIYENKEKKRKISPVNTNRASEIGHPCLRYLVYLRIKWSEKALPSFHQQLIFDEGKNQELSVIRDLLDAGIEVIEQQRSFWWEKFNLTGHIDGKCLIDNKVIPFEVKSLSPYIFETINNLKDMLNHKRWWVRKYPYQMIAYLLLDNQPLGVFILKNKATGELKEVKIFLEENLHIGEEICQKCEKIEEHIKNQTLPDRINNEEICDTCPFAHICLPELTRPALQLEENAQILEMLEEREALKEKVSRYNEIDEYIKDYFKKLDGDRFLVGQFLIMKKKVKRNGYTVPPSEFEVLSIKKLKGGA
jgi:antitoxin component of RelBE/YafQ-DinJ toxin-antitoxin module